MQSEYSCSCGVGMFGTDPVGGRMAGQIVGDQGVLRLLECNVVRPHNITAGFRLCTRQTTSLTRWAQTRLIFLVIQSVILQKIQ